MDAYMPMAYTSIFMAAKLDREVASNERMLSVKSHNPMITWIHQVKCQKNVISPFSQAHFYHVITGGHVTNLYFQFREA